MQINVSWKLVLRTYSPDSAKVVVLAHFVESFNNL